jgi:chitinase
LDLCGERHFSEDPEVSKVNCNGLLLFSQNFFLAKMNKIVLLIACLAYVATAFKSAPYLQPTDSSKFRNITSVMHKSGTKHFILAFVHANGDKCEGVWDTTGDTISEDKDVVKLVREIRSAGGDVAVSFGGAGAWELANRCSDVNQLTKVYEQVITKYKLKWVDLDIEGHSAEDIGAQKRRFQAIKSLKPKYGLKVSLTIPADLGGIDSGTHAEIKRAVAEGLEFDLYTLMTFDYDGHASSMAKDVQKIMEKAHGQLSKLRTDLNSAQVYEHLGMILMNGHTDSHSEGFDLSSFKTLVSYAQQRKLGRISFWVMNRDFKCSSSSPWTRDECSGVSQSDFDFSKIISAYH